MQVQLKMADLQNLTSVIQAAGHEMLLSNIPSQYGNQRDTVECSSCLKHLEWYLARGLTSPEGTVMENRLQSSSRNMLQADLIGVARESPCQK